jgi:sortase (surface protein transpeptidase)
MAAFFVLALLAGACAPAPQNSAPDSTTEAETVPAEANSTAMADNVIAIDPLSPEQAVPPVNLSIAAIDLTTAVEPMGWEVTEMDGLRTTKWIVPEAAAGWHVNSAGAGGDGNVILSGHQLQGEAVFAPISLGEVVVGQQVLLEDEEGVTFVYEVVDVSEPIPVSGAGSAEEEAALAYVSDDGEALLTLITGWPDFTTTHRVFVQAALAGVLN